jgi:hypothetical protein
MKYLLAVKGGMDPKQWAQLHPTEWARLIEIAPLKQRDSQPTPVTVTASQPPEMRRFAET